VQQHDQQRIVDLQVAVVFDEPELPELVHKEAHGERVVPIISASTSWLILVVTGSARPSLPKLASRRRSRAKRFSLELKS